MKLYDIILAPDPVLKEKAQVIETVSPDLQDQIERMFATMYHENGIGLAANQVGLLNRVFVMDLDPNSWAYDGEKKGVLQIVSARRDDHAHGHDDGCGCGHDHHEHSHDHGHSFPLAMINPEIVWKSEQRSVFDEGCLSLPTHYAVVERPAKIVVKFQDAQGNTHEREAEGLESHCIQHELDHLDGILFVDHISRMKRDIIIRKMEKMKKSMML